MIDLTNIPPMTEEEMDELFPVPPTREDVEYYLNDLPQESGNIIRRYIDSLEYRYRSVAERADRLDRAQYSPGNGDMGG